jgi:uncharacterized protein YndB with AHSA1/START domain
MSPKTESAYFVIADISGYTSFVSGVELEHAHDIIGDIMDTLVRALRPPFRLAKFEGDAAFVYALANKVDGITLQDSIEAAYFAIRKRLRNIKQSTTCECKACARMQDLDLKFVLHHGEFIKHKMAGREEIAGKDVILVHRFLKNDVKEKLGFGPYALYSAACVEAMGIDPAAQGLVAHTEHVDIIGEVRCWVGDLAVAWRAETATARTCVAREDAALLVERDLPAPPATVWEWMTVPQKRASFQHNDGVVETKARGRRGAGTQNHCMHGKDAVVEDILDWRPHDYVTLTTLLPAPDAPKILMSFVFTELPGGATHLEMRAAKPKPKDAAFVEKVIPNARQKFTEEFEALGKLLEGETGTPALVEEPARERAAPVAQEA